MNQPKGYVLKFISGKYQGGEFPIDLNQDVIIGRSSDLDMVLVEDMVSRQHSRIFTEASELYIEDLGSTNGTFVNGEKVTKKRLKEGDRILVGTSIIKLVSASEASGGGGMQQPQMPAQQPQETYQPTATSTFNSRQSGQTTMTGMISGLLEEVPLPDLLQLFSTSKKSGVLILRSDRDGRIYLRSGRLTYALIDGQPETPAEKAFYRMLSWSHGTFMLDAPSDEVFEAELDVSMEAMMMEGMRLLDEINNLGADRPAFEDNLHIEQPLMPPLRALTPELLDTLQLIHNHSNVEAILNQSLATDLETLQDIVYLVRNEYIRTY